MDLEVPASHGNPALTIPAAELGWRFSRSSGPGGQHVNTSDSRVELFWNVTASTARNHAQRTRRLARPQRQLVGGVITVSASEQRSQLRNRETALAKLADVVAAGLAPDAAPRRPTRRTRGSDRRRLSAKNERSATKQQRRRPTDD